jgi:C-terminal processing protease CtpA/Prc
MMNFGLRSMVLIVLASMVFGKAASAQITEHQLRTDVEAWRDWMESVHPDRAFSADVAVVDAAFDAMTRRFQSEYDVITAWRELALMNPVLNDAHTGLRLPDTAFDAAIGGGAIAFPVPVRVSGNRLFIESTIQSSSPLNPGDEILTVNGQAVGSLIAELVPRMRGESRGLRERVLSLRFPIALWTVQGDRGPHVLTLAGEDCPRTVILDPERDIAVPGEGAYGLDIRGTIAILRADSFDAAREEEIAAFLPGAFARIASANVDTLIIDVRENGGGARQVSDRLMAYLTSERYTPISAVKARIVAENQALIPGSEIGQVIETPFTQWVQPPAELANRFEGRTIILIGPASYSQAIVFGVTAQDFGIAEIAGTPTEGFANQTGQVQRFTLPETGLVVQAPLYILMRPSGEVGRTALVPDRIIPGRGEEQLSALIAALND